MNKYELSIILPCYKVAQYIEKCVNSILQQDFNNYEVIIIDDGSPDNLLKICKQWESLVNFKIQSFPNQGLSQARNEGLKIAQGKYIYFLDPDDYIEPNTFSYCYNLLEKYQADAIRFGFKATDVTNQNSWTSNSPDKIYLSNQEIIKEYLPKFIGHSRNDLNIKDYNDIWKNKEFAGVPLFIYRREVLIKNQIIFPKGVSLVEDKISNAHFFCYAKCIININKVFYNYFIKPSGLMLGSLHNPEGLIKNKIDGVIERDKLRDLYLQEHNIDILYMYYGSLILSGFELCLKLSSIKFTIGYKGLKKYLTLPTVKNIFKNVKYKNLPLKVKLPIFCIKNNLTIFLFIGLFIIRRLKINIK